jgi:branched-chain amino acid transport system permease protein
MTLGKGNTLQGVKGMLAAAVVAGAFQVIFGAMKLGRKGSSFPTSVIHGMMAAIGLIIIAKQVHNLMGYTPESKNPMMLFAEIPHAVMNMNPIVFIVGAAALLGVLIHIALIQPLLGRPMLSVIMLTIALSIALRALIEIMFGPQGRSLTTPMPTGVLMLGSVRISYLHLTAALVSWACMAGFGLFFRFTSVGLLMRASADSHEAAVVSGVNVNTMNRLAWAIGSTLAAIGGLFLGQLQIASTELEGIGLLALPAVVIGGMQSIPGAIVGGLLVGIIEQMASTYISPKSSDIVIYVLLLLILMVRPWGLFGQKELGRV